MAKLTHKRYGMSRAPAKGVIPQKATKVATINAQSKTMSAKAKAPRCQPKNNQLHSALNTSCTRNRVSAVLAARKPATRQTSQAAIPIRAYSTVQTGPKTQDGGAHSGRTSWV